MAEFTKYAPGTPNYVELATTDAAGAKKFYSRLFGWAFNDIPLGEMGVYTMCLVKDKPVAALYEMGQEERSRGVPPHWRTYISIANADETAKKARSLGGQVIAEPMDVFEEGRMAMIQDPTGAMFAVWQPRNHIGAQLANEPGTLVWNELATKDRTAAEAFYTRLFNWNAHTADTGSILYTSFMVGEHAVCGMMEMTEEWGDMPSHWSIYLGFADVDAGAAKIKQLGGKIHVEPHDIPDVGRFALAQDPQGAMFSIIQMNQWA
jgi:hypothetical protein